MSALWCGDILFFSRCLLTLCISFYSFDAYRVVGGADMEEGQAIDPKAELVATKCAELVGESIPGESCMS